MTGSRPGRRGARSTGRHHAARLAAVQALYQVEMTGQSLSSVIEEFVGHRLGQSDVESSRGARANEPLFRQLVRGTGGRIAEFDGLIRPLLAEGWKVERLEVVLRCILRLGTFEMVARPEVPAAVVIKEYVDLADDFFSENEPAMVNGILDRLARQCRPGELEARHEGTAQPTG